MKLKKMCLLTLSPIVALAPAVATSCSLFADSASKKVYDEGSLQINEGGKFQLDLDFPEKIKRDSDLVITFKNTVKYPGTDKLIHKDLEPSNVYYTYQKSADVVSSMECLADHCTIKNNVITISKEFVNQILDKAKHQLKYTPSLNIYLKNCQVSSDITWKEIGTISDQYVAKQLFSLGDVLTLKVNNVDHRVRIADFNKFKINATTSTTFVFEFIDVISDSDGKPITTIWDDNSNWTSEAKIPGYYFNYIYKTSVLNAKLNTDIKALIQNALGNDAKGYMKTIIKPLSYSDKTPSMIQTKTSVADYKVNLSSTTTCFVPCVTNILEPEVSEDDLLYYSRLGEKLAYYEDEPIGYTKTSTNGTAISYWVDTPDVNSYNKAWCIDESGKCATDTINDKQKGIAPCFCF